MDRRALVAGTLALCLAPVAAFPGPTQHCGYDNVEYELVELGDGFPSAINELGQVAGTMSITDEIARPFVWSCADGMENIGALEEVDPIAIAHDINNRGQVVGENHHERSEESPLPFIWDRANGIRTINPEAGIAYEINDWGDVALIEGPASVWNVRTGMQAFDDVTGLEVWGFPRINDLRQVGGIHIATDGPRFFVWGPLSGAHDLGPLPPIPPRGRIEVMHMNERGDLVGAVVIDEVELPFMVSRNRELQLLAEYRPGRFTSAVRVNNRRQVVVRLSDTDVNTVGLWDPVNGLRPISEVLAGSPDAAKYASFTVSDINDNGWMTGSARRADQTSSAAMFVPIPKGNRQLRKLSSLSGPQLCRALKVASVHSIAATARCAGSVAAPH